MSKTNEKAATKAAQSLPALPPKRARRRSVRASHSWCWRKPPSRKRVEISCARHQPTEPTLPTVQPVEHHH